MKVLEKPLDALSRDARVYPAHLLSHAENGLCLFAAAFLGVNDAIHMARQEMTVTCVDTNQERLEEMSGLYPDTWTFRHSDAWEFAWNAHADWQEWDVVSVDNFTGDIEHRVMESLELWCSIARRLVTVTHTNGMAYRAPEGWDAALFPRSSRVNWLVLTRA